ncbi:uncharacterized protein LOC105169890 isoform X8 [Sesamum indicum]|uniref:Uncharacterized protein LOC105169890 isoform X8 n=1 Tax=Sesamum indicum TaxID=4182 RepID=A0A8M8UYU5_SESIN|nr:uncharacterized protein LOC105169890 isoform X8 [Sesamum indicum]
MIVWLPMFLIRKRRKPFMIMKDFMEIKEMHTRKRDSHDTTGEARSCRRIRTTKNNLHFQVEITSSVMERAEEIQANLATQFPSFVKPMIRSNVTGGFWLVYIVRANHFSAVDAAVSLLHLQACADVVNHEHFKEGRTSPQVPEKLLRPPSQEMLCSNFDKFEESFKSKPVSNDSRNISKNIVCFRRNTCCGQEELEQDFGDKKIVLNIKMQELKDAT